VEELLSFELAEKDYGSKVIGPLSFSVRKGEIVGLLGPNGSGKSTSIRMALGLARPSSGKVLLAGLDPYWRHSTALKGVGYSPELPNLQTFMTPVQLLQLVGRENSLTKAQIAEQIPMLLETVGLAAYSEFRIGKLSKGMVQRLSVAQAMMGAPRLLILDEPMIGIDPAGVVHFRVIFRDFVANGGTIILSSHVMSEVESLCTSVVMIHSGRLVFAGPTEEFIRTSLDSRLIRVEVDRRPGGLAVALKGIAGVIRVTETATGFEIECEKEKDVRAEISKEVVSSGAGLTGFGYSRTELDDAYVASIRGPQD
jgi:ABC-2 type transport system ATP-binding protein